MWNIKITSDLPRLKGFSRIFDLISRLLVDAILFIYVLSSRRQCLSIASLLEFGCQRAEGLNIKLNIYKAQLKIAQGTNLFKSFRQIRGVAQGVSQSKSDCQMGQPVRIIVKAVSFRARARNGARARTCLGQEWEADDPSALVNKLVHRVRNLTFKWRSKNMEITIMRIGWVRVKMYALF